MSVRAFRPSSHRFAPVVGVVAVAVFVGAFAARAGADPTIRFKGNGLDRFKFHGRVRLDPPTLGGPVDPVTAGFGIDVLNDLGFVYRASLVAGDLEPRRNLYYRFRDRDARYGNGTRSGLFLVITRFREYADGWYYTVRVLAYADLSAATEPRMTVVLNEVDGTAAVTGDWIPMEYGWRLPLSAFAP